MNEALTNMAPEELFVPIKALLSRKLSPIEARISVLESRKPEKGEDGKNADVDEIAAAVLEKVTEALKSIPAPKDGKDADPEFVRSVIRDEVARAVAALPSPAPGKDAAPVDMVWLAGEVMAAAAKAVAALPVPKAGRDFDPELLKAEVARVFTTIPKPENGKDADPEFIKQTIASMLPGCLEEAQANLAESMDKSLDLIRHEALDEVDRRIKALPPAEKGKDANASEISDQVIERVMRSIRVPEDGKSVTLDEVRPILEGEVSRWQLEFERRAADMFQKAIDRIPAPKDGLGFDDLEMEEKDDRTVVFVFRRGAQEKRFEYTLPMLIDRGTYKSGDTYQRGDAITYGGSLFIAQRDTLATEKPEDGSGAFRLAVKRGRDGGGS